MNKEGFDLMTTKERIREMPLEQVMDAFLLKAHAFSNLETSVLMRHK